MDGVHVPRKAVALMVGETRDQGSPHAQPYVYPKGLAFGLLVLLAVHEALIAFVDFGSLYVDYGRPLHRLSGHLIDVYASPLRHGLLIAAESVSIVLICGALGLLPVSNPRRIAFMRAIAAGFLFYLVFLWWNLMPPQLGIDPKL